jgi:XTP/dITP diphosphohydrolase
MKRLLLATLNQGKIREFAEAFVRTGIDVVGLDVIPDRDEVEETGETFEANARLKADYYSSLCEMPVLADDSGLEVDALGGEPGVRSARYGGPGLDTAGRNQKLLEALQGIAEAQRTARFRCVLAVARAGETLATFEGAVEGRILEEPQGDNGFGYDPLFFHPESGCTTAELSTSAKRLISHRGAAIQAFLEALQRGDERLGGAG